MGPLAGAMAPDRLIFGDAARPPELGDQLSLEWVGAPNRGRVTFHPFDATLFESVTSLHRTIGSTLDVTNPDLTRPTATANEADAIRNAGAAGNVVQWTEERIEVGKPATWRGGAVLIWRDSLPTLPLVIPQVPLPDLCVPAVLREAVTELFKIEVAALQLAPAARLQALHEPAALASGPRRPHPPPTFSRKRGGPELRELVDRALGGAA
jgi:hypothetical protein